MTVLLVFNFEYEMVQRNTTWCRGDVICNIVLECNLTVDFLFVRSAEPGLAFARARASNWEWWKNGQRRLRPKFGESADTQTKTVRCGTSQARVMEMCAKYTQTIYTPSWYAATSAFQGGQR